MGQVVRLVGFGAPSSGFEPQLELTRNHIRQIVEQASVGSREVVRASSRFVIDDTEASSRSQNRGIYHRGHDITTRIRLEE